MDRIYEDVVCNYNTGDGFWTVDAWYPNNEEGVVVAVINELTGGVYAIKDLDDLAKKVIADKVKEINGERTDCLAEYYKSISSNEKDVFLSLIGISEKFPLMDEKLVIAFNYDGERYECVVNRDEDLEYNCPECWDTWIYDKNGKDKPGTSFRLTGATDNDGRPTLQMSIIAIDGDNYATYIYDIDVLGNTKI